MIHAFRLFTGPDQASHVEEGYLREELAEVTSFRVAESATGASFDWHNDPTPQYVISLCGTLEFTTRDGERFILRPGDVLVAEDHVGTGHKWRLIDQDPWRRAYVAIAPGSVPPFVATGKPASQP